MSGKYEEARTLIPWFPCDLQEHLTTRTGRPRIAMSDVGGAMSDLSPLSAANHALKQYFFSFEWERCE